MSSLPIDQNLLPRPPKVKGDGSGYDWREFDRFLQKIYLMLGYISNSSSFNIPEKLKELEASASLLTYDSINNDISPYQEDLLQQIVYTDSPYSLEQRISTLESELVTMMNQLDILIEKADAIISLGDTLNNMLVELRVNTFLLNEGMNMKENLQTLRNDEESDREGIWQ